MRRPIAAAVLCAALLYSGSARATSMRKLSLGELAKDSKSVVHAKVTKSESRWDGKEIYTYTTLSVISSLKGARKGETIVVRQLGGTVGTIASIVPGMPSFESGEEVFVFLTRNDKSGHPWVNGFQQGQFTVSEATRGKKSVSRDTSDLNLIGGPAAGKAAVDFDQFVSDVRDALGVASEVVPSGEGN